MSSSKVRWYYVDQSGQRIGAAPRRHRRHRRHRHRRRRRRPLLQLNVTVSAGPIAPDALAPHIAAITPTCLCWKKGMDNWIPCQVSPAATFIL